jgi:hypothetical protein
MQIQWEYQAFQISGGSLIQGLNKIGADGWQAMVIEHRPDHELVICKRPKSAIFAPDQTIPLFPANQRKS